MTPNIIKEKLLIVEGKDEVNVFTKLLNHLEIDTIQIFDIGGKDRFKKELIFLKDVPGFDTVTALGVIRDADNDANIAFQSVAGTLKCCGLTPPDKHNTFSNNIPSELSPKTCVFIISRDDNQGMLEDLCLASVENKPAMKCVIALCECISELWIYERIAAPKNIAKAKTQAYLACMPDIAGSIGVGAEKSYWNLDNRAFDKLKSFIRTLKEI
ncbi:hypothetical protein MCHI_003150 [Candidatus Magnetoovum chiemensis]|nr:hypothetical protein MCHI_003150 [Candidatus Magnetoovum chiemensis]